jgi:hypothetical protein
MQTMKSTSILGEGSSPGYRDGEKKRIKAGIIEALAEIATGCHYDPLLGVGDGFQCLADVAAFLRLHSPF